MMGLFVTGCGAVDVDADADQTFQGFILDEENDLLAVIVVEDVDSQILLRVYYDDDRFPEAADFTFEGKLKTPLGEINDQFVEGIEIGNRVNDDDEEEMFGSFTDSVHTIAFVGQMLNTETLELELRDNGIRLGTVVLTIHIPDDTDE